MIYWKKIIFSIVVRLPGCVIIEHDCWYYVISPWSKEAAQREFLEHRSFSGLSLMAHARCKQIAIFKHQREKHLCLIADYRSMLTSMIALQSRSCNQCQKVNTAVSECWLINSWKYLFAWNHKHVCSVGDLCIINIPLRWRKTTIETKYWSKKKYNSCNAK